MSPRWSKEQILRRTRAAKAHSLVQRAVQRGELAVLDGSVACLDCGGAATGYDHRNYMEPLKVEPVCHVCNLRRGRGDHRARQEKKRKGAAA